MLRYASNTTQRDEAPEEAAEILASVASDSAPALGEAAAARRMLKRAFRSEHPDPVMS